MAIFKKLTALLALAAVMVIMAPATFAASKVPVLSQGFESLKYKKLGEQLAFPNCKVPNKPNNLRELKLMAKEIGCRGMLITQQISVRQHRLMISEGINQKISFDSYVSIYGFEKDSITDESIIEPGVYWINKVKGTQLLASL